MANTTYLASAHLFPSTPGVRSAWIAPALIREAGAREAVTTVTPLVVGHGMHDGQEAVAILLDLGLAFEGHSQPVHHRHAAHVP